MIRNAAASDKPRLLALYRAVAAVPGGLARTVDEIGDDYVAGFMQRALASGVQLVCEEDGVIVGEIHASSLGIAAFAHLLTDLTIAVAPAAQGRGIGRLLFQSLLQRVGAQLPHISRVELFTRESNLRARQLYTSLGFVEEGRLAGRVSDGAGGFEADIVMGWSRS